jgi:hypothetical protein
MFRKVEPKRKPQPLVGITSDRQLQLKVEALVFFFADFGRCTAGVAICRINDAEFP